MKCNASLKSCADTLTKQGDVYIVGKKKICDDEKCMTAEQSKTYKDKSGKPVFDSPKVTTQNLKSTGSGCTFGVTDTTTGKSWKDGPPNTPLQECRVDGNFDKGANGKALLFLPHEEGES